jgi:hypothetical protein
MGVVFVVRWEVATGMDMETYFDGFITHFHFFLLPFISNMEADWHSLSEMSELVSE